MKETILSNCERNFILRAAQELKRLDGRNLEEFRTLKVHFGQDRGLCYVSLGETKCNRNLLFLTKSLVLTQVTCEIQEPKTTRPNEGLLFMNVELSSMAVPHFEPGRASDLSVHKNRLLEKCIKDSRAIGLESLCIVADEKVWTLRVDVNVLNHEELPKDEIAAVRIESRFPCTNESPAGSGSSESGKRIEPKSQSLEVQWKIIRPVKVVMMEGYMNF